MSKSVAHRLMRSAAPTYPSNHMSPVGAVAELLPEQVTFLFCVSKQGTKCTCLSEQDVFDLGADGVVNRKVIFLDLIGFIGGDDDGAVGDLRKRAAVFSR